MKPVPGRVCAALLLLALTAFSSSSSSGELRLRPSATPNTTTVHPSIESPNHTATTQITTKTETTVTTVLTTGRPATTKSGSSTATATTAASANSTSADIITTALPIVSHFDIGSFVGGIVLALAVMAVFYLGRRFCISRSGTRYRTIEETEAII
ncbi:porimin-like [Stegostoma tigrinum]|uniref:porimin-like n=1 Tax=Stegostoma tigrinum TaxID=3053191 RepID=UPI00202B3AF1|nr:porimin-like [Stegostoma tigrinum]